MGGFSKFYSNLGLIDFFCLETKEPKIQDLDPEC